MKIAIVGVGYVYFRKLIVEHGVIIHYRLSVVQIHRLAPRVVLRHRMVPGGRPGQIGAAR